MSDAIYFLIIGTVSDGLHGKRYFLMVLLMAYIVRDIFLWYV